MLYQKLLVGKNPYIVAAGAANAFERHIHPEIELSYCLKGEYIIRIGNRKLRLTEGDLVIVNPMAAHEFPQSNTPDSCRLTIVLGPGLLGEHFDPFVRMNPNRGIIRLKEPGREDELYLRLASLLEETAQLRRNPTEFSRLLIRGNLYKVSAMILQILSRDRREYSPTKSLKDIANVERSMEIIYNEYSTALDLKTVSEICGYSTSNFCKVFKQVTGDTFHNILNSHRADTACMYLKNSSDSIEKIAVNVGFADSKAFCRIFKKLYGLTPSDYRKKYKPEKRKDA